MRLSFVAALVGVTALVSACGGGSGSSAPGTAAQQQGPPTSSFGGLVSDRSGAPIAGVTVTVYLTNDHTEHLATTDATGHYTVTGLLATGQSGNYEIWANKAGFAFLAAPSGNAGTVIRADHNALYKTVIAIPGQNALTTSTANFTALRSGDRIASLPRTGQLTSFASGDDADLARGTAWPAQRFLDNQNGTITDTLTGLIWLRDTGCLAPSTWPVALTAVSQLAPGACSLSDGSTAGQWRLPNVAELESLVDSAAANPAVLPGTPFAQLGGNYWSSTTYRGDTTEAWVIRFTDGRYINDATGNVKATSLNGVWAVRTANAAGAIQLPSTGQFIPYAAGDDGSIQQGPHLPYPRFIDNQDGTVSDTVTGLVWLKRADCVNSSWAGALGTIATLGNGQCGLTDGSSAGQWRMPNRAELLSLLDRAETNQALRFNTVFMKPDGSVDQAAVFTNFTEFEYFWTSTTDASDSSQAWTVFSCDGGVYNIAKANIGYSLAVR